MASLCTVMYDSNYSLSGAFVVIGKTFGVPMCQTGSKVLSTDFSEIGTIIMIPTSQFIS